MTFTRRELLLASAAVLIAPGAALADADPAVLNQPPAFGEMAMGPEDAKVTLIEYASASCPHCADFYKTTFPALKSEYIDTGKIRFVLREFPHNPPGLAAFMLARCAPKEKYFPMVDLFFLEQEKWLQNPKDGLYSIAQRAGFTPSTFEACLKNEEVQKGIIAVRDRAANELGVTGIPTFFINGKMFEAGTTIEEFRAAIDPLLG
jgi:protein-disulfide isomerase